MRVQMYGECCFALPSQDDIFHARALSMTVYTQPIVPPELYLCVNIY